MKGTIKEMFEGSDGGRIYWIRECPDLAIVGSKSKGCKVGAKIKATGEFWYCDFLFDDECDSDALIRSRISCQ